MRIPFFFSPLRQDNTVISSSSESEVEQISSDSGDSEDYVLTRQSLDNYDIEKSASMKVWFLEC